MDTETIVSRHRADILRQLVELASDRAKAQRLLEDLGQAEMLLNTLKTQTNLKYVSFKKAREVLMAIFEESQRPWPVDELIDEVVNGGFRGGRPGTRLIVQKSIQIHINGDGAKRWPLKKVNGLVGPAAWPDEKFANGKGAR